MKTVWTHCIKAAALAYFLAACCPIHGQQLFVHTDQIRFTVRIDPKSYAVGESILIHYSIQNVSHGALYVPAGLWDMKCGDPPHFLSMINDADGKDRPTGYGSSCGSPNPIDRMSVSERMRKDALLLKPGQTTQGSFSFDTKFSDLHPGRHHLVVELYGWNQAFSVADSAELAGMGAPFLTGDKVASASFAVHAKR